MRSWISTVVAIALFAHAVADASGHDGHRCVECEAQKLRQLLGTNSPRPLSAERSPSEPEHPCHCELHCGGSCNYLPSQKSLLDVLPQTIVAHAAAPNGMMAAQVDASCVWTRGRWREFESPPLRLHLWNQLLLI
jgi:hypothetical protein